MSLFSKFYDVLFEVISTMLYSTKEVHLNSLIEQPLSNSSWQIYINRSEYLFFDILKKADTHLCHTTKIQKLDIILLRLLRKIEQNRRLPHILSFYRLWICLCWWIFQMHHYLFKFSTSYCNTIKYISKTAVLECGFEQYLHC